MQEFRLMQEPKLNFTGAVTVTDNAGTDTTTINISSGLTTGTQIIIGDKTFSNNVTLNGNTSMSTLSFDGAAMAGHILPTQNAQFDIGSAEYKVRHLSYLIIHYGLVINTS